MFRTIALTGFAALLAAAVISLAPPARAQIGNIFSDPPPRPPGNILARQPQQPDDDEEVPDLPRGRVLPTPEPPAAGAGRAASRVGAVAASGAAARHDCHSAKCRTGYRRRAAARRSGRRSRASDASPPGRRQAKTVPQSPATLQPGDEVVTEPPAQKIVNKKASFSGLDKITGRIINFDEDIGETVQFGALRVKTDACYTRPATEAANTDAFVEVDEITLQGEVKRIFSGWMFAASPGLHGVEHPIYDIWLTDCKDPETTIVSAAARAAEAAHRRRAQKRAPPKQAPRPPPIRAAADPAAAASAATTAAAIRQACSAIFR